MCLLHASQIVLDKSPSIIFKRSQEYVVETCFIRREDRFISHPCCISASSKSPPSPLPFSYLILIQAQGFLQNHFEISLELHFYPQVSLLLLPLLSVQQSKEIPIWNKCWLENDWQLHKRTFFYNWGMLLIGISETCCLVTNWTCHQQCVLSWSFPQNNLL